MAAALFLAGCGNDDDEHVPPFGATNDLVVAIVNGPATYFEDAQGNHSGLEFDLVSLYANRHGFKVEFLPVQNQGQITQILKTKQAHIAAAGSPFDIGPQLQAAPTYLKVQPQIICNSGKPQPKSLEELAGKKIEYAAESGISQAVKMPLKNGPSFIAIANTTADEIIRRVSDGQSDCAAALSNQIDIAKNFHPNIAIAFKFGDPLPISWILPEGDQVLSKSVSEFFAQIQKDGTLERLLDRYYGHTDRLDQADIVSFLQQMNTQLEHFRPWFEEAGELTGFDWRLLAALAYQESHWNEHATSPTGVRGMMMLTNDTADRLNVDDRLDGRQSILAGARYLAMLREELSPRIFEGDKPWAALAAYNIGTAHIEDARVLAKKLKLNPNTWLGLKETLPLLSEPGYFSSLKHGFARGGEAVIMVGNVRSYYDILQKYKPPQDMYRLK